MGLNWELPDRIRELETSTEETKAVNDELLGGDATRDAGRAAIQSEIANLSDRGVIEVDEVSAILSGSQVTRAQFREAQGDDPTGAKSKAACSAMH
eukprot:1088545-Pyramimonas_sp.AAC.1